MPFEVRHDPPIGPAVDAATRIGRGQRAEVDRERSDKLKQQAFGNALNIENMRQQRAQARMQDRRVRDQARMQDQRIRDMARDQTDAYRERQAVDQNARRLMQEDAQQQQRDMMKARDLSSLMQVATQPRKFARGYGLGQAAASEDTKLLANIMRVSKNTALSDAAKASAIWRLQAQRSALQGEKLDVDVPTADQAFKDNTVIQDGVTYARDLETGKWSKLHEPKPVKPEKGPDLVAARAKAIGLAASMLKQASGLPPPTTDEVMALSDKILKKMVPSKSDADGGKTEEYTELENAIREHPRTAGKAQAVLDELEKLGYDGFMDRYKHDSFVKEWLASRGAAPGTSAADNSRAARMARIRAGM